MLRELFLLFLKLGTISFGGPAAHIAMMQDEVVARRKWLTQQEFLDFLSATNFIPGPNSTELAIHIGYKMAGWRGLLVAGLSFILPAVLIVSVIAWFYVTYGDLPTIQSILYGIKPVIIAVVFQAIWSLGKSALKSKFLIFLGALAFSVNAMGLNELTTLAGIGLIGLLTRIRRLKKTDWSLAIAPLGEQNKNIAGLFTLSALATPAFSNEKLFFFFLKVGSILFGSGYVLLAVIRSELVDQWRWLTEAQLLDAVAVGQLTPGPVFTTATFIGYILSGPSGAALATIGIFLPAFVFVALSAPWLPQLRASKTAAAILDGVNVASLAVMTVTGLYLAKSSIVDFATLLMALAAIGFLIRFKVNSAWLVLGGGLAGYLLS